MSRLQYLESESSAGKSKVRGAGCGVRGAKMRDFDAGFGGAG